MWNECEAIATRGVVSGYYDQYGHWQATAAPVRHPPPYCF